MGWATSADFRPLPEYSGERPGESRETGGLDCAVAFPAGSLAPLGGKTVRIRVSMKKEGSVDPRLFAVHLRGG